MYANDSSTDSNSICKNAEIIRLNSVIGFQITTYLLMCVNF
jgi:hypothetical protein